MIASASLAQRTCICALQLYMWDYTRPRASPVVAGSFGGGGGGGQPHVALKTRRSLRAVHFHPHGRPLMLTAEVKLCLFMSGGCCWWVCCCLQCRSIVIMAAHTDKRDLLRAIVCSSWTIRKPDTGTLR